MASITNRVKVQKQIEIEINNFAFEVNVILGLKSTYSDWYVAKIGLNGPEDK